MGATPVKVITLHYTYVECICLGTDVTWRYKREGERGGEREREKLSGRGRSKNVSLMVPPERGVC